MPSYSEFVKKNYDKSRSFKENTKRISELWKKQKGKAGGNNSTAVENPRQAARRRLRRERLAEERQKAAHDWETSKEDTQNNILQNMASTDDLKELTNVTRNSDKNSEIRNQEITKQMRDVLRQLGKMNRASNSGAAAAADDEEEDSGASPGIVGRIGNALGLTPSKPPRQSQRPNKGQPAPRFDPSATPGKKGKGHQSGGCDYCKIGKGVVNALQKKMIPVTPAVYRERPRLMPYDAVPADAVGMGRRRLKKGGIAATPEQIARWRSADKLKNFIDRLKEMKDSK